MFHITWFTLHWSNIVIWLHMKIPSSPTAINWGKQLAELGQVWLECRAPAVALSHSVTSVEQCTGRQTRGYPCRRQQLFRRRQTQHCSTDCVWLCSQVLPLAYRWHWTQSGWSCCDCQLQSPLHAHRHQHRLGNWSHPVHQSLPVEYHHKWTPKNDTNSTKPLLNNIWNTAISNNWLHFTNGGLCNAITTQLDTVNSSCHC